MSVIAAYNFCNKDFEAFLAGAAAAGFENVALGFYPGYLDLPLENLSAAQKEGFESALVGHGLKLIAVYAPSNLQQEGGLDLLRRKLDGAASLGVSLVDTGAVHWPQEASDQQRQAIVQGWVESIRAAGDHAASLGITIALETHGGYTGDTPACLRAMDEIAHAHVRIAFDCANYRYYSGADPHERLDELAPFVAHTHYKDHRGAQGNPDFPRLGEGEVGYETLLPKLKALGYQGPHTLERAPGDTPEQVNDTLRYSYAYLVEHLR